MKLGAIFVDHAAGFWGTVAGGNEENVFVVRNGDLASDGTLKNNLPLRSFSRAEVEKSLIRSGDILLSTSGDCGKTAYVADVRQRTCVSNFIRRLRVDDRVAFPRFAYHLLRSREIQDGFRRFTRGTTLQNLSLSGAFNALEVALPPIEEQRRIAAVLDAADALRAKRRQALAKLDTLTQAIFIDMFGDPRANINGYTSCNLEEIAEQVTDGEHATPPRTGEGVRLLSARNVRDGYLDMTVVDHVAPDTYEKLRKRCDPQAGDLLISCSGTIGRVAQVDGSEPLSLVRSVALVRPIPALVESGFLEAYLQTPAMRGLMVQRANASSQANLFQNQIRRLPVLLPPIVEQQSLVARLGAAKAIAGRFAQSSAQLDALFASLQQRAFRGEL